MNIKKHPLNIQVVYSFKKLDVYPYYDYHKRVYRLVIRHGNKILHDSEYQTQELAIQSAANVISDVQLFMPKAENNFHYV